MTPKYQERLYKALKSTCEAEINQALASLDRLFSLESESATPTEVANEALTKLTLAEQKLKSLENYMDGSKPLKQLLND